MIVISLFWIFILFVLLAVYIFLIVGKCLTQAPFLPVLRNTKRKAIEYLQLQDNSVFYDLGCGDGRVLLEASNQNPKVRCIGIELAPLPYLLARIRTRNYKQIHIQRKNIFTVPLHNATHVYMYLMPKMMNALLPRLMSDLQPGTKLISCDFMFKDKVPIETIEVAQKGHHSQKLYIYEF